MPRTRRDVWKLGNEWDESLLWYARAVKELRRRPFADMTSWRYLAAIHGVSEQLWRHNGYLASGETLPNTTAFQRQDKDQCQHHTWYFLPWHRGYLRAFEKIVAAAIAKLGGPNDWALPYWNYNDAQNPNRLKLPPAFGSTAWPDGGTNPLFVAARYGRTGHSGKPIELDPDSVELETALTQARFVGAAKGGSPGFGGRRTAFQHGARDDGDEGFVEHSPHDNVHGDVGGALNNVFDNRLAQGLMSNPTMAALDPIFWLHHANIDRLWEVWLKRRPGHVNPTHDSAWMHGPAGARPFVMPEPDNKTHTTFHPSEMLDTTAPSLDYIYEDVRDPFPAADRIARRMEDLRLAIPHTAELAMAKEPQVELLGADADAVHLASPDVAARVRLDPVTSRKVLRSFQANELAARGTAEPDRIFLNLENITGSSDATSFKVYVGLKPDENPQDHPENFAGIVTLFGLNEASALDRQHGGNGLNKVLEITKVIDRLHLGGLGDLNELSLRFVLRHGRESDVSIGRISIYRQGE
jgi:tyrosinase